MGNQLTLPQKLQPEHLAEVPKFVLKENLGKFMLLMNNHELYIRALRLQDIFLSGSMTSEHDSASSSVQGEADF